ncbi:MAG: sodium:solute symporter family transporter [Methyloceanibacter sp.]|uniref:sodium:solute symporter family transporter n=1 Tax=Methyloceanibacter sp. TaxID=1965321 RepID=UPI003D9BD46A
MSVPSRLRTPNPHLGAYYGIVTSAFLSLVIMLAMFEQLGWGDMWLAYGLMLLPLAFYIFIAVGARTRDVEDFFVCGRRVPAVYNGFVLAATAVGGVGFFAYTGTVFFLGFDALAIGLGWAAGMLIAAVLFSPYLHKAGAYTLPSFLGHRFRSRPLRMAASVLQLPATGLLLAAEIQIAAMIAAMFLPLTSSLLTFVMVAIVAGIAIAGGMRTLTWSGSAEFLIGTLGLAVPLIIVSVLLTHIPAPQLTYGESLTSLPQAEMSMGISPSTPDRVAEPFPGAAPQPSAKLFLQAFGALSTSDFIVVFLCVALGTAALPSLLVRSGVTSSAVDQRKSTAWGVLFVVLFVITAPAIAAFAKLLLFGGIAKGSASALPAWLGALSERGLVVARDLNSDGAIAAGELLVARDGVALALPIAAELPFVCTVIVAAGGMGIALAAAASHLFTLAGGLSEDLYRLIDRRVTALPRLMAAWAALGATAVAAILLVLIADPDPLRAALDAFAFAAAAFFPVLVLGIWWKRATALGAMAAMGTGFGVVAVDVIVGSLFGLDQSGIATLMASLIGVVVGLAAGVGMSLFGPEASAAEEAYFEEMRDPMGETIYDRAQQRAALAAVAETARTAHP